MYRNMRSKTPLRLAAAASRATAKLKQEREMEGWREGGREIWRVVCIRNKKGWLC